MKLSAPQKRLPAILTICIDYELAWGFVYRDRRAALANQEILLAGRASMFTLIKLFDQYQIPATWAFVGHLLLDKCCAINGVAHPEIHRPTYSWLATDWFADDPCSSLAEAPLWYASDFWEEIISASVKHEVASHSFAHFLFGEPGLSESAARSDFAAFEEIARIRGFSPSAFVYPTHKPGFREMLAEYGFKVYRATTQEPFTSMSPWPRKVMRLLARLFALPSSPATPIRHENGVWEIPASMHFAFRKGTLGKLERIDALVLRAKRGLNRLSRQGGVFTLYFHDHNFGIRSEDHLAAMEQVLTYALFLQEKGDINIMTMTEACKALEETA